VPPLALLAARAATGLERMHPRLGRGVVVVTVGYSVLLGATHVRRLTWEQQLHVARFIAGERSDGGPDAARVAIPAYGPYLRLAEPLTAAGLRPDVRLPGRWLRHPAPHFVVPEWYATAIRRDRRNPELLADLEAIERGAEGYRPVLRIPRGWYLQQPLDAYLDPGLATDLWQGSIGFTVYARGESVAGQVSSDSGASAR
jgi:hypothetical protein